MYAQFEDVLVERKQQLRESVRQGIISLTRAPGPILHRNQVIGSLTPSLIDKWKAAGDYRPLLRLSYPERPLSAGAKSPSSIPLVQFVQVLVRVADSRGYLAGDHIYSVKTKDMLAYGLDPEEIPVLAGCRSGQLFHSEVYGSDPETLTKAVLQIQKHSKSVVVGLARLGEARIREFEFPSH